MRIVKNEAVASKAAAKVKTAVVNQIMIEGDEQLGALGKSVDNKPVVDEESLQHMCLERFRAAVQERADLAFQEIPHKMRSAEELGAVLE